MVQAAVDIGKEFEPAKKFGTLASLLNVIIPNIFLLAGVILFFLLIVGGFGVIAGAGSGDPGQTEKGKKAVTYALLGFAIIFLSWWVVKIVEVVTGVPILKPGF